MVLSRAARCFLSAQHTMLAQIPGLRWLAGSYQEHFACIITYQCTCNMIFCGTANVFWLRFSSLAAAREYWIERRPASEQAASCGKAVTGVIGVVV